jgi:hypothetical protein
MTAPASVEFIDAFDVIVVGQVMQVVKQPLPPPD